MAPSGKVFVLGTVGCILAVAIPVICLPFVATGEKREPVEPGFRRGGMWSQIDKVKSNANKDSDT